MKHFRFGRPAIAKPWDVVRHHKQNPVKNLELEIRNFCYELSKPLLSVSENGIKNIKEFDINCCDLKDYNLTDIRKEKKFQDLFSELGKLKGPCLYIFEIKSNHSKEDIIQKIIEYSLTEDSKKIPAIKSKVEDSTILYVGKVKRAIFGRLIQHLGYFKTKGTQGLQLFYWAKNVNLDLKFTVVEFENDMENLMNVLENEIAKKIKPILGKHK